MAYQWIATSVAGFVQQLAVAYVAHGYYFYVTGTIPPDRNLARTDQKILAQYDIAVSKHVRARRKKTGAASIQYLRHDRFYVIIATHGEQGFFAAEAARLRDIRSHPLRFMGYAIGCRKGRKDDTLHPSVRIERDTFRNLKERFNGLALRRSVEELCAALRALRYESYAPVRDQLRTVVRSLNRRRHLAGLEPVPLQVVWSRRRPVRPFAANSAGSSEPLIGMDAREDDVIDNALLD